MTVHTPSLALISVVSAGPQVLRRHHERQYRLRLAAPCEIQGGAGPVGMIECRRRFACSSA